MDSDQLTASPSREDVERFARWLIANGVEIAWTFGRAKDGDKKKLDTNLPREVLAATGYLTTKLQRSNIILPAAASSLFLVDGDTDEIVQAAREIIGAPTFEILTGSGKTNLVARAPEGVETHVLRFKQGDERRLEAVKDGYLVAPLSIHPDTGELYVQTNELAPVELTREQVAALAALPRTLGLDGAPAPSPSPASPESSSSELRDVAGAERKDDSELPRHELANRVAAREWRHESEVTSETSRAVLERVRPVLLEHHPDKPYSDRELSKYVREAAEYAEREGFLGEEIASSSLVAGLWTFEDLREPGAPTLPPDVGIDGVPLFYCGQRNALSGESSGGKTWAMLRTSVDELRRGFRVVWLDMDSMGRERIRERLLALGATTEELSRFHYVRPRVPANDATLAEIVRLVQEGARLVVLDTMNPALGLHGKDPNATTDVEAFLSFLIDPVADAGGAPVTVDHVTKSTEGRGRYAYGSERKQSGADVHLSLVNLEPFGRGETGASRIVVAKDRDGWLGPQDSTVGIFELASVGSILTARVVPEVAESDELILSKRAELVSDFLEREGRSSGNTISKGVSGRALDTRSALRALVRGDFVVETKGARGARMFELRERYILTESGPLDFVPTSSREGSDG